MANDIAFCLGILALLGSRIPAGLRSFLSTLTIADDIIAIMVIAVFYTANLDVTWLAGGLGLFAVLIVFNRLHIYDLLPYIVVGLGMWACFLMSGVHATIAGVLLALAIPARSQVKLDRAPSWFAARARRADDRYDPGEPDIVQKEYLSEVAEIGRVSRLSIPPITRLDHRLHIPVYFFILPLFAFSNASVVLTGMDLLSIVTNPVTIGVFCGLLFGKPLGIFLATWLTVKLKLSDLPQGVNWGHIGGVSVLGGVGFTMAIFVANLAFTDEMHIATAKLAILAASLIAGVLGFVFLLLQAKAAQKRGVAYVSASSDDVARQTAGSEVARESEELLRGIEDHPAIKSELEAAKKRGGVFEIVVDLGPTGLLGGGSIGDVREAVRNEVVRVLKEEGKDDLLEKVQEDFNDEGKPPLLSVEEALLREGGEEALRRALHHEEEDVEGVSGDTDSRNER